MTGPLYGRPYTGDEMDLAHQDYHATATTPRRPVFTTRPTGTGSEVEGIVVMVNGEDLLAIMPTIDPDGVPWELGWWDQESGEWVDGDPAGDFIAQLAIVLAREPS